MLPEPGQVVVALGSGGTAAGLALGFAIAGMRPLIIAARVVPRIVGRQNRILRLVNATRAFIERHTGAVPPSVPSSNVRVDDAVYGGAYGRVLARGDISAARLSDALGATVHAPYPAKAFVAAPRARDSQP